MGEAYQRAVYGPFTRETGIEIVAVPGPSLSKLRLEAESGRPGWDVVNLLPEWLPTAIRLGLLERIDGTVVRRPGCVPQARSHFAVGVSISAAGIGFTTSRFGARVPRTWPEYWDIAGLPGRRSLLRRVTGTLEAALMADGVPPAQVYPCDVARAFGALDRIKPHVNHWISQTQQSVSLIEQDETDFSYTYSTRVKDMEETGVPIGYSFAQNLLEVIWVGIVKGTSKKAAAMRLCAYLADPERQAALSSLTGDAPTYPAAIARVGPAARPWLPRIDGPDNLFIDAGWWDARFEKLSQRFQNWLFVS